MPRAEVRHVYSEEEQKIAGAHCFLEVLVRANKYLNPGSYAFVLYHNEHPHYEMEICLSIILGVMYSKTTNKLYENVHYSIVSKSEKGKLTAFSPNNTQRSYERIP